jgi:hypothetical protein
VHASGRRLPAHGPAHAVHPLPAPSARIFTPKFGLAYTRFRSKSGGSTDGSGGRIGFQWGIQAALELDIFEPRAARSLDEEWGINHSYLFFELYGVQVNNPIDVGTDLGWVAGLGLEL